MPRKPLRKILLLSFFTAMVFSASCSVQTDQTVTRGRIALVSGRPEEAVEYFSRAAEADPNYKTSDAFRESIWTYLGRAYYEMGKYGEAMTVLNKALTLNPNDSIARLYLGMTLTRSNDRERGLADMQTGLNGIHAMLDSLAVENVAISYWDPNKRIRKMIESSLSGKPNPIELVVTAQRVGKLLEDEIDREKRDRAKITIRN